MNKRVFEIIERLNHLQERRVFHIVASIIVLGILGLLYGLIVAGKADFMPLPYRQNLLSSTIISSLVLVGSIWLNIGITAFTIMVPSVCFWLICKGQAGETSKAWGEFILAVGSMTVTFLITLAVVRLIFSLPWQPLAVSRLVLDEAVRMKVALIFIILLIVFIPILASRIDPVSPLRYRIQTFISYGTGLSYGMLAIMTLFVSTASVAFEQRDKQIFQIVSKPISRFNYLLGKWIGVMGLNAVLLILVSGSVFWFIQYLSKMPALNEYDALATSEQVLTARVGVKPELEDMSKQAYSLAKREIEVNQDQYHDPFEGETNKQEDLNAAFTRVFSETLQRLRSEQLSIGAGEYADYVFKDVKPQLRKKIITAEFGKVIELNDPVKTEFDIKVMSEDKSIIYVNGIHYATALDRGNALIAILPPENQDNESQEYQIHAGQRLYVQYYPANAMTLRFKINSGDNDPGIVFPLSFQLPDLGTPPQVQNVALIQTQTLLIPAGAVRDDGTLNIRIINGDVYQGRTMGTTIKFPPDGLEVMYKVSNFSSNYFRGMLINWMKLGFLAMLGIAAATFASFPVACLLAFAIFLCAEMGPYMTEALQYYNPVDAITKKVNIIKLLISWVANSTNFVLRTFGNIRPTQNLEEGRLVSWVTVGRTWLIITLLWTGLAALFGWMIFRMRQLAIYSGHA